MLNNEFQWEESSTELADDGKRNTVWSVTPSERNSEGAEISTVVKLEQRVNTSVIIEHLVIKTKTQQLYSWFKGGKIQRCQSLGMIQIEAELWLISDYG